MQNKLVSISKKRRVNLSIYPSFSMFIFILIMHITRNIFAGMTLLGVFGWLCILLFADHSFDCYSLVAYVAFHGFGYFLFVF